MKDKQTCPKCKGDGDLPERIMDMTKNPPYETMIFPPCDECDGSGEVDTPNLENNNER